jgi:PAS domain S-box-containing protein
MLFMTLSSLLLFFYLRDRGFLWYVFFLFSISFYFFIEDWLLLRCLSSLSPWGSFRLLALSISLIVVWSSVFSRTFLLTKTLAPKADKLFLGYIILGAGLALASLVASPVVLHFYSISLGLLAPFIIIGSGLISWRRGFLPARLYLAAWGVLGGGAFIVSLNQTHPWGSLVFQISVVLNTLLLNLALVDRLSAIRQERDQFERARLQAEAAQKESERRFRAIFDGTFQFISLTDPEGRVLEINQSALKFLEAREEEVRGHLFWETPWWAQFPEEKRRLEEAFDTARGGQFVRFELQVIAPAGERHHLDFSLQPIRDKGGRVALLISEGRDISDRVRSEDTLRHLHAHLEATLIERELAEEALRDSENKYRTIFENAQVGLFRIRISDGKVLESNTVMARIFGYPDRESFIDQYNLAEGWVDPADRSRLYRTFHQTGGTANQVEASFFRPDGTTFWARFSARLFEDQGYMEGVGQDITEEKHTTQDLIESESKYRTIFEAAGSAMIIFEEDGRLTLANREFTKLTGQPLNEQRGSLSWMKVLAPQSLEKMKLYHQQRSGDPSLAPRSYEISVTDAHGRRRDCILVVEVIPATQQRVAAFLDITERKQAEQQMLRADKMAALGQIIAGVAHEINNPNNFIYFNLPILKRYIEAMRPLLDHHVEEEPGLTLLNMPYHEFIADVLKLVDNMQHGSERITGIVSELKNYIRGQDVDERKPASLSSVINRVMVLVGKQVQKMVKTFDVTIAEDLPPVLMNAGKIEQVMINLIINASQAADKTDSWVKVNAHHSVTVEHRIEIIVEDNGAGIAEENIDHIFEPFFTTKGREAGTGLGLAISQRIIEEHDGTITVASNPGQGTRFCVTLPTAQDETS